MTLQNVKTVEDAMRTVDELGLQHVKVGVFDVDGILRGKYMSRAKFFSALKKGFGFCDVVLGWDSADQLYDNVTYTGWHTAYPDAKVRIIPESCRSLPGENTLFFLCEFDDAAAAICPRRTLSRVLKRASDMGFVVTSGLEYEFFMFDETPKSAAEKNYQNLSPITPGNFGYSLMRAGVHSSLYEEMLSFFDEMNIDIEGLHTETGPGVLEAALSATEGIESADRAALFRTFTKIFAQRRDQMATFMAKWSNQYPGQSGHTHISLANSDGTSAFFDAKEKLSMSETMRRFVAGQQKLMPEFLAMISPTVNSFSRLVPGFWAPTHSTWGHENRTCALRVIEGGPRSQRVEFRVAASDANPYLVLAAALASGLYGIENELELSAPTEGNAYDQEHDSALRFPATLFDAAQRLRKSSAAATYFGHDFVDHFAATREWEEREFRKHITDWELKRYFEII